MDEREMLQQIRRSAEQVDIPDALYPDAIEQQLMEQQNRKTGKRARIHRMTRRWGQIAAALALMICGGAVFAVTQLVPLQEKNSKDMANQENIQQESASDSASEQSAGSQITESDHVDHSRVEELGDMYHQADSYGEIYGMVSGQWIRKSLDRFFSFSRDEGDILYETEGAASGDSNQAAGDISNSISSPATDKDYSDTNLVTEGVDEGDTVKTDGDYIYTIEESKVVITDIRDGALEIAAEITPGGIKPSDDILELYVEKNTLMVVLQSEETELEYEEDAADTLSSTDLARNVMYWNEGKGYTSVIVYDISDRSDPQEVGRMTQDGSYETSRRIGDKVYLFTYYQLEMPDSLPWNAVREENAGEWLPRVNGSVVGCDDVYLPDEGSRGLLIASVDIAEPEETLDSLFIVDGGASVYASTDVLYLYRQSYDRSIKTQIARFNLLSDGCIEPVEATEVKGAVQDTFALNEHEGYLRVLTTDWSDGTDVNYLYVLDENMELAGSIGGIAPGEEIYSARFFGNIGYFVTYRNTDPLFTVDLSDPEHPEIIGELKMTGFSEYLHFWDENHLIGIGYETDPESGDRQGLKLSMFNISDPANVTEEAKYVLSTEDYSDALYEYKKVLISPDRNIIGFSSDDYDRYESQYNVFSYENGSFVQKMAQEVDTFDSRGIYSQDTLYLLEYVGNNCYGIDSYDMNNGFSLLKERE